MKKSLVVLALALALGTGSATSPISGKDTLPSGRTTYGEFCVLPASVLKSS